MVILQKPTATVGQVIKDLEQIVAKSPGIFLEYSDDDAEAMFVEGVKLRKDIAIMETTHKKKRAATVEELLAIFRMLDASVGVVMQDWWELLNLEPNVEGSIFWYDEENDYCQFRLGGDLLLVTTQQMEAELNEKCDEENLARKVVLVSRSTKKAYLMNCMQWRYGKLCLCYSKDEKTDSITVASFMEEFPTCAEFMVLLNGKYYTIEVGEKGIFFGIKKGDEKYLGFYIGEVVYDPREEWY